MYLSIQYLRGVAALSVVFVHLEFQLKRLGYDGIWPRSLEGGVDLFFVISGFVIWIAAERHSASIGNFAYRRMARIVPLYWLVTTAIVIMALMMPHLLQSTRFDLNHVVTSYLFVPYETSDHGLIYPILVAGWTLNYEMFFYAVFAVCLAAPARFRLALLSIIIIGLVIFGQLITPENTMLRFWSDPIILEFLYGIFAAVLIRKARGSRTTALFLAILALLLWFCLTSFNPYMHRALALGIPAFLLVFSAALLERSDHVKRYKWAERLGDSSYALYLTHGIVLSATIQIWRLIGLNNEYLVIFSVFALSSCVVVGFASYSLIDRPTQNWLRKKPKVMDYPAVPAQ